MIIIPIKSMPQPRHSHSSKRVKGYYDSQEFLDFKKFLINFMRNRMVKVDVYPIYLDITYSFVDTGGTIIRSDIDNHLKITIDALVQSGVLKDDSMGYVSGINARVLFHQTSDNIQIEVKNPV